MLLKLISNLDLNKFEVSVISLTDVADIGFELKQLGVDVYSLSMQPGVNFFKKFFELIHILKENSPDIVQTWMYHADFLGGIAAKLVGVKNIFWGVRHSDLSIKKNKKRTLLIVALCALVSRVIPSKIITCSEYAKIVHVKIGYPKNNISVIPNGFDLDRFAPDAMSRSTLCNELNISEKSNIVGIVARYHPQKNYEGFLSAAKLILEKLPQTYFIMVGDKIDYNNKELLNLVKEKSLNHNCKLLGQRADIPQLLSAMDVLTLTSWGEAFPNVIGEAMACETPCVVTDAGDSAEIVGKTGFFVKTGDMKGIADYVVKLLNDKNLINTFGKLARKRVFDNYEISKIAQHYSDIYEKKV